MKAQTLKWDEWIVLDDGEKPTVTTLGQQVIRVEPFWQLGQDTLQRNLLLGLSVCQGDTIFIIEDDDWYSPIYLYMCDHHFNEHDRVAIGATRSLYYHIRDFRHKRLRNINYSVLAQTAIRGNFAKQVLLETVRMWDRNYDRHFWRKMVELTPTRVWTFEGQDYAVGIKGMPGRPGLGTGHDAEGAEWTQDKHPLGTLRDLIGRDADLYLNL